jgi:hypothetical protein
LRLQAVWDPLLTRWYGLDGNGLVLVWPMWMSYDAMLDLNNNGQRRTRNLLP